jgi:hypothetical protein
MDELAQKERKGRAVRGFPRSGKGMAWVFKGIRAVGDKAFLLGNPHILQNI